LTIALRIEDFELDARIEVELHSLLRLDESDPLLDDGVQHPLVFLTLVLLSAVEEVFDPEIFNDLPHSADVIGVWVRRHGQIERLDVPLSQRGDHIVAGLRQPGVNQNRFAFGSDNQGRIALSDVERIYLQPPLSDERRRDLLRTMTQPIYADDDY